MENPVVLLVHLDHGEGEHAYTLYQVPESRVLEAEKTVKAAWRKYEAGNRDGEWGDAMEAAVKASGIPYDVLTYEPVLIEP